MEALIERIKRAQQARDNNKESTTPSAAPRQGSPRAEFLAEEAPIPPAEGNTLHLRIATLTTAREEATAKADDGGAVDQAMNALRTKRLLEDCQGTTMNGETVFNELEPSDVLQRTSALRSGASNTSTGKYVSWNVFRAERHPGDSPSKRRAPMPEDSEDDSEAEVDDEGITMGPMGDAPVLRMTEDNLKAAIKFVEQLGNVECAQRHFSDATITGTQSDVDDYTSSIAASSYGYITLVMGRAIKLEQYLATRDDFATVGGPVAVAVSGGPAAPAAPWASSAVGATRAAAVASRVSCAVVSCVVEPPP